MKASLGFKFFLLFSGFVVALASINLLHFNTSKKVNKSILDVENRRFPLYAHTYQLKSQFEEVVRNIEDAVTTGEKVLLERAYIGKKNFEDDLKTLYNEVPTSYLENLNQVESDFSLYFSEAYTFAHSILTMKMELADIGNQSVVQKSQTVNLLREKVEGELFVLLKNSRNAVSHSLRSSRLKISKQLMASTLIGLIASLVLFGFLLLLSRRIIGPIKKLSLMTAQVAKGNFDDKKVISVSSRDEVGELSRSFQLMKKGLRETTVSKAFVDNIIRSIGDTLIVVDSEFKIKRVNRAACEMLGYYQSELMGQHVDQVFSGGGFESWCREVDVYHQKEVFKINQKFITKNKREIPVLMTCSVLKNKTNERGLVCVAGDITDLKKVEEELKRSNSDLEHFAYVASHDLQEPLRMVTSYLQLLQKRYKGRLDESADEFIYFAVDGAARMKLLINDLLTYSRVRKNPREKKSVSCDKTVKNVLKVLQPLMEEQKVKITQDDLPEVVADPLQLEQLFQNLIGNAIKYRGKEQPKIHVGVEKKEGYWQFSIQDNGIGIGEKYRERIFVIFQRLHTQQDYPGTGIGLAVCKKIVEQHEGRIWVESEEGSGSVFCFTLPFVVSDRASLKESEREPNK